MEAIVLLVLFVVSICIYLWVRHTKKSSTASSGGGVRRDRKDGEMEP
jgi:hypothetical protein